MREKVETTCNYCNDGSGLYGPCPICGHYSDLEGADTFVEIEGRPISVRMWYVFIAFVSVAGWFLWSDADDYAGLAWPFKWVEGFYYHAMIAPMKAYWNHNLTDYPRFNVLLSIIGIGIAIGLPILSTGIHLGRETKARRRIRTVWKYLNFAFVAFMAPAFLGVLWWAALGIWQALAFAIDWLFAKKS